jgi:2-dehydropantoate 2-reductase
MLELEAVGRAMGFHENDLPPSAMDALERTRRLNQNPEETLKPSMLIDIENSRPMELEVVLGHVVKAAKEHNVNVPVSPTLDLITRQQIHELEARIDLWASRCGTKADYLWQVMILEAVF